MEDIKLKIIDVLDKEFVQIQKQLTFLRGIVVGENSAKHQNSILYETEVTENKDYQDYEKSRRLNKEDKELPRKFKNTIYKSNGITGHIRLKPNKVYEIRCQVDGHQISVSSSNLKNAKKMFDTEIASRITSKTNVVDKEKRVVYSAEETMEFAIQWFETVKKPTLKPKSLDLIGSLFKYLKRYLKDKKFSDINLVNLQKFINSIIESGHIVTAKHVKTFIGEWINAAIASNYMTQNPAKFIKLPAYQPKRGVPLTIEEEQKLLSTSEPYKSCFALMLYTGCRIGELFTMFLDDPFIVIKKSKQRKGMPDAWKRVPITPMLKKSKFLIESIKETTQANLTKQFKMLLPDHHPHEMRHTFISRAQECGIPREVVSVWAGHAADNTMTSKVYTHFSDEFMLKEGQKLDY